jgi:hypothetical protein
MYGDQLVALEGSPPLALAARDKNDSARLVRKPISILPDSHVGAPISVSGSRVS